MHSSGTGKRRVAGRLDADHTPETRALDGKTGRRMEHGQEIVCSDSTITVHVNGQLQNRLTGLSNRQGFIGLQSEGGPVQFRNIILTPLD
ncbi:MAG: family 16 glycoside hydrolase [Alistipes ihumii]